MLDKMLKDPNYIELMQTNVGNTMKYFLENSQHFDILCKIDNVDFSPVLPAEMNLEFRELTIFSIAGYTFETAYIQDNHLVFEADFGEDRVSSVLSLPLGSIMQIMVQETIVLINLADYKAPKEEEVVNKEGVKNSMASFLNNPENSKFLNK